MRRLTLVATILGSTVVFLDATVVNVALPTLSSDLGIGLAGQQWVVEAYLLALVSFLLVGGSLGDRYGRRRLFVVGLAAFGLTSALCALAPSDEILIGARALQGIAGALLVPGSLAIVAAAFSGAARGTAIGTWTAWTGIATVLGPAGGGALIETLSWRWIFWVNVPLCAFTIALTLRAVAESRDPDAFEAIDRGGIALSAVGLGGPVFALIEQPDRGWGDPLVFIPLLAGVACFALFLWHEARTPQPMLDLGLFRIRNFAVANVTTLIAYAGLIGGFFFIGLFLQQTAGYSPLEAGLATIPTSGVLFALSPAFGRLAAARGPRLPMTAGPIVAGAGLLLFLRVDAGGAYVEDVLPATLLFGLGLAATVAPLTTTVLSAVPEGKVGIGSGINNGVSRVAGLLAIAILGAVISGHFGNALSDRLSDVQISARERALLEQARDKPLGSPPGGAPGVDLTVTESIEAANVSAFHLGMTLAGGLLILGGAASAAGIRGRVEQPSV